MSRPARPDILDLYATGFRPGMVDLSSSSPSFAGEDLSVVAYPEPGGTVELRSAIARLYPGLSAEHVVVTNGASEALAASALTFVMRGTSVSLCPGAYPSFSEMAERLGGRFVDAVAAADVVLLNNPTVPDGSLRDTALAGELSARGCRLVCDEVYLDLRPGASVLPAALCSTTAVSIGDLSKPLGLGGLRIGWAVSQDLEVIARLRRSVQVLSGGPSTVAMAIATEALGRYEETFSARAEAAAKNAPLLFATLREAGWSYREPGAGWTFCARPPAPAGGRFERAAAQSGLFLASTNAFGMTDGSYRISLFAPVDALRAAIALATPSDNERVVVIAKAPAQSKSRLARETGKELAFAVATALIEDTMDAVRATGRKTLVAYTPASARAEFAGHAPFAELVEQPCGDLGDRLTAALDLALHPHARAVARAVLIGTDTPQVTAALIDDAFCALRAADIVLGPASDGGFYLLGLATPGFPCGLFDGVEWSTDTVFDRVTVNAKRLGLCIATLPAMTDVDDLASLQVVVQNERLPGSAQRTADAAARALEVLK